jgi:hypothetical protein
MILAAASVESSYSEGLLLNLGVGVLLFAALYVVQRHLLDRVRQVREETEKSVERISENVEQVRQDLAEARIRLEEVGPLAQAALARERERDKARLRSLDESVDFDTVRDLLNRAKELSAISNSGLRIPAVSGTVWTSWNSGYDPGIMAGWAPGPMPSRPESIRIRIEDFGGKNLGSVSWLPDGALSEVMTQVGRELQRKGVYPGDQEFNPSRILERLQGDLAKVLEFSTSGDALAYELGPVIEVVNDEWVVTDFGVQCLKRSYTVETQRLGENWPARINQEVWADIEKFERAYFRACALFEGEYPRAEEPP